MAPASGRSSCSFSLKFKATEGRPAVIGGVLGGGRRRHLGLLGVHIGVASLPASALRLSSCRPGSRCATPAWARRGGLPAIPAWT